MAVPPMSTRKTPSVSELPEGVRDERGGAESFDAFMRASMRRMETLIEEQEARNRVVLEVVQGHNARFERIEARLDETQSMIVEILDIVRGRAR